jgi:rRNA-processing protein EBP2
MVKKGKLLVALEAHKGLNHKLERDKKLRKQAEKLKRAKAATNGAANRQNDEAEDAAQALNGDYKEENEWESEDEDEQDEAVSTSLLASGRVHDTNNRVGSG